MYKITSDIPISNNLISQVDKDGKEIYSPLSSNIEISPNITIGDGMSIESELKRIADNGSSLVNALNEKDMSPTVENNFDDSIINIPPAEVNVDSRQTHNINVSPTPIENNLNIEPSPLTVQNNLPEQVVNVDAKQTHNIGSATVNNNIDLTALATANTKIAQGVTDQIATNKKLVEGINSQKSKDTKVIEGVNNQVSTNLKVVKGIESQTDKNDKQIDHLDFEKNGVSTLKDSDDKAVIPREAKALKNAEKAIETKDMNSTFVSDLIDDVQDILGEGVGSVLEFVSDVGDSAGDGGFGDKNPFNLFMNIVKEDATKSLNEMKESNNGN